MKKIAIVKQKVEKLYLKKNSKADPWAKWAYSNHVLVVAKNSANLAIRLNASEELSTIGALLHDIADTEMPRSNPKHEKVSFNISSQILKGAQYSDLEIETILNEIIAPHSCNDIKPSTIEGKILATSDAMAHLQTDFYLYFCWQHWGAKGNLKEFSEYKNWVLKKIEKDFHQKIQFEEIREELEIDYSASKRLFSR